MPASHPLRLAFLCLLVLGACARTEPYQPSPKPVFNGPVAAMQTPPARSNRDLAEIYIELAYGLESDERHPGLRRFEGPVRIGLGSAALEPFRGEVEALAARIRREADVDIALVGPGETPNLTVHLVPREELEREAPTAACFVAYVGLDWNAYRARTDEEIEAAELANAPIAGSSVFIPSDVSPHEMRGCLTEEIIQGLGLGNDLYTVPETIFNDDDAHVRATRFDMRMLRLHYHPELRARMPEAEARVAALAILDAERPEGSSIPSHGLAKRDRKWSLLLHYLSLADLEPEKYAELAGDLEAIALGFDPDDLRLGFSKRLRAIALSDLDPAAADAKFDEAREAYRRAAGPNDVRVAEIDLDQAILLEGSGGDPDRARRLLQRALPVLAANDKELEIGVAYRVLAALADRENNRDEMLRYELEGHNWLIYAMGADYGRLSRSRDYLRLMVGA